MIIQKYHKQLILLFTCWLYLSPETVWSVTAVTVGDYHVQVHTNPDPLMAGKEAAVTLKILRRRGLSPVLGEEIFLDVEPMTDLTQIDEPKPKERSTSLKMLGKDNFGNYEFQTIFLKPDTYYFTLTLTSIEKETFAPPLTAGFTITVEAGSQQLSKFFVIMFLLLFITGVGVYLINLELKKNRSRISKPNLLNHKVIKRLLKSKSFQPACQILLLVLFIPVLVLTFVDIQDSGKNLSVILIWTLWWAGIIFTFVLVGRLWCFMCPVGAITEWTARIFKPHRLFPAKFRNLWIANFMFIMLTWLDIQLGVVRNPVVTGSILVGAILVAIWIGTVFKRRTFCRYLCPIGGLIGIYAMFSPLELRTKDKETCKCHKRKDCYLGNQNGLGCPMLEMVPQMDNNRLCNFCGECIKSCPKDNITIRFRPFFKDAWNIRNRSFDEAVFAVVLVGVTIFVTGDMLEPWAGWMDTAMQWFPSEFFGIKYQYTIEVLTKSILYFSISLFFIPGLILVAAAVSNYLTGHENHHGLRQTFTTFAYMFIPIGLSMHLAHNTGHLLTESGGIIPALQRTINKYSPFNSGVPDWRLSTAPLIDSFSLYAIQMGLFLIFYIFSLYTGYRLALENYQNPQVSYKALLPMILVALILILLNVYLLNLPMAPRHVH